MSDAKTPTVALWPSATWTVFLSVPLENNAASEPLPGQIRYVTHDGEGLEQMKRFFGVKPEDLVYSKGLGWAVEEVQAITHTGTHVDAPYHYGPESEEKPARRIDQVDVDAFVGEVDDGAAEGVAVGFFEGIEVGDGGAPFRAARGSDHSGFPQQGFGQRGLSRPAVAH